MWRSISIIHHGGLIMYSKFLGALGAICFVSVQFSVKAVADQSNRPDCTHMGESQNTFNTKQILDLKKHSAEGTLATALIQGTFTKMYRASRGQRVFQLKIGPHKAD